jgi:hypothetical protein
VDLKFLLTPEVRSHAPATTARCLMKMLAPLKMESTIWVMVAVAKVMVPLVMVMKTFLILMLVNEAVRCDWVVIFGL